MLETLLVVIAVLIAVVLAVQIVLLRRKPVLDASPLDRSIERTERACREEMTRSREEGATAARQAREELAASVRAFADAVSKTVSEMGSGQRTQLVNVIDQLTKLTDANERKFDSLRCVVEERLRLLQDDNSKQLEQMRTTVDEKLQGTLEKRLGESFRLVSERLEQVHQGLGEMQSLASGVGDLKRVLTNVKCRGTWGEVQLGTMLEQVLTPEQYATNVSIKDNGERVEFAIKLPGRSEKENEPVLLPIDVKYPTEDYDRLLLAQERADADSAEEASKQLEARIKSWAQQISDKYLEPPKTTEFAILYLPTEGLFAEVVRRIGLTEFVQRQCKVLIAGPTTLWSILNSFQLGFRTLAIQKRSSEVWAVLGAVKTEFDKYGDTLTKVQKKLNEASDTIDKEVATRTRAIQRRLRNVQELPAPNTKQMLPLGDGHLNGDSESEDRIASE